MEIFGKLLPMRLMKTVIFMAILTKSYGTQFPVPKDHINRDWAAEGQKELESALKLNQNTNIAKNVILFLNSGLGLPTVWAARVYAGQTKGMSGEEYQLAFEQFDHVGLSKIYSVDFQIPDSTAPQTAVLTGEKTNAGTFGVNQNVHRRNCSNFAGNQLTTILDWSLDKGKSVGIVSNLRVTVKPATAYANSADRSWESDTDYKNPINQPNGDVNYNAKFNCDKDTARQLIEDNPDISVILGGGRSKFLPKEDTDPEYSDVLGQRSDSRNLINEWKEKKSAAGASHAYVWNKKQFDKVDPAKTDYLFGLFEPLHMQNDLDRDTSAEPSLAEMTKKAIQILQRNKKGFFLLVDTGKIDLAHHRNLAKHALHETLVLDEAVKVARKLTKSKDTLIVVTGDHSHSFTSGGDPSRGNDILGFVDVTAKYKPPLDDMPYMTLAYATGTSAPLTGGRRNLTGVDIRDKEFQVPAAVPLRAETHSGEDVPIYAHGPMAHLFHGVHEQNYIVHVLAYASCVGPNKNHCKSRRKPKSKLKGKGKDYEVKSEGAP